MVRFPGDFEDPNVVVPGLEFDDGFDEIPGNSGVLGIGNVGLVGFD